jgi:S1-C subfamily serine protease
LRSGERPAKADEEEEAPRTAPKKTGSRTWQGAKVQDLDAAMRSRLGLDAKTEGAVVSEVEPDSVADQLGLRPGDVISAVNGTPVADAAALAKAAGGLKAEDGLVLDVNRQGQPLYLSWRKAR